jgi:hypothetical protein
MGADDESNACGDIAQRQRMLRVRMMSILLIACMKMDREVGQRLRRR